MKRSERSLWVIESARKGVENDWCAEPSCIHTSRAGAIEERRSLTRCNQSMRFRVIKYVPAALREEDNNG